MYCSWFEVSIMESSAAPGTGRCNLQQADRNVLSPGYEGDEIVSISYALINNFHCNYYLYNIIVIHVYHGRTTSRDSCTATDGVLSPHIRTGIATP